MFGIMYHLNGSIPWCTNYKCFKTDYILLLCRINPSHTFLYFYVLVFLWSLYYHNNNKKKTFKLKMYSVSFIGLSLRQYSVRHIAIRLFQQLLLVEGMVYIWWLYYKENSLKIPLNKTLCSALLCALIFFYKR